MTIREVWLAADRAQRKEIMDNITGLEVSYSVAYMWVLGQRVPALLYRREVAGILSRACGGSHSAEELWPGTARG